MHAYVHLRHLPFPDYPALVETLAQVCATRSYAGEAVEFVDGTVFSPDECYLTLGSWADAAPATSDYTRSEIYYRSIQSRRQDWLTVRDYLWRWDTDWFWCSRAFGAQRPWVRRLAGPRLLRSDVYWRILAVRGAVPSPRPPSTAGGGLPPRENVIQDVEVPVDRLAEFVAGFQRQVPISPIWLCPLRQRDPGVASGSCTASTPATLYVNVGFWSSVPLQPGMDPATTTVG